MSLEDHQTGRDIVSPYILIGRGELTRYAVNTESFQSCQSWLILPDSIELDARSDLFRSLDGVSIPVFACVGDYDRVAYGVKLRVSIIRPSFFEREIGILPLDILRKELPKVCEAVERDIADSRRREPDSCPF